VVKRIVKEVTYDGERYVRVSDICAWLIAGGVPEAAQVLLEAEQKHGR
jgi:hypothetical protein